MPEATSVKGPSEEELVEALSDTPDFEGADEGAEKVNPETEPETEEVAAPQSDIDWNRRVRHPKTGEELTLEELANGYMRDGDYRRKTQETARDREKIADLMQAREFFEKNPTAAVRVNDLIKEYSQQSQAQAPAARIEDPRFKELSERQQSLEKTLLEREFNERFAEATKKHPFADRNLVLSIIENSPEDRPIRFEDAVRQAHGVIERAISEHDKNRIRSKTETVRRAGPRSGLASSPSTEKAKTPAKFGTDAMVSETADEIFAAFTS